jgi:hypothetical protein
LEATIVMRILTALLLLLVIGTAAAQPPVDYTLVCDGVTIGTVSYVDGEYHVALLVGATCEAPQVLSILEDESLDVTFELVDGVITFTIGEDATVPVLVEEVPQQALDGRLTAHANRAGAGHGPATAAAMRELHQPERPARPELPVAPELPVGPELPEMPELPVVPSLPEAAGGRRP